MWRRMLPGCNAFHSSSFHAGPAEVYSDKAVFDKAELQRPCLDVLPGQADYEPVTPSYTPARFLCRHVQQPSNTLVRVHKKNITRNMQLSSQLYGATSDAVPCNHCHLNAVDMLARLRRAVAVLDRTKLVSWCCQCYVQWLAVMHAACFLAWHRHVMSRSAVLVGRCLIENMIDCNAICFHAFAGIFMLRCMPTT